MVSTRCNPKRQVATMENGTVDGSPLARTWAVAPLAAFCCSLWGSAFAFVKRGYELFDIASTEPAQQVFFAGMRFTLAGIMVLVGTAIARKSLPIPQRKDLRPILLLALMQTTLQYIPFYIGLAHATGTNSSLVQGSSAFVSILVATLVFRQEPLTGRKLLGCALGFAGVALVTLRAGTGGGSWSFLGEGLILVSVTCGAFATCLLRRFGVKGDPLLLTGWQFVVGGSALMLISAPMGGHVGQVSAPAIGVLVYLGALSATAFSIWSSLLKHNVVSRVAIYRFLIPAFGVLFSITFLHEAVPAAQVLPLVLALSLIIAGTVIVNTEKA